MWGGWRGVIRCVLGEDVIWSVKLNIVKDNVLKEDVIILGV